MLASAEIENEKSALAFLSELIISEAEEDHAIASDVLKNCKPSMVLKLIKHNPDPSNQQKIKEFCMLEGSPHVQEWADTLREQRFQGKTIKAIDGTIASSTLDQYLGSFLFNEFKKNQQSDPMMGLSSLRMACELNFFYALRERVENNVTKIKAFEETGKDWQEAEMTLLSDSAKLGHTFWSLGYIHSALILLDLGNTFAEKHSKKSDAGSAESVMENERYKLLAIKFYEEAVSHFFRANFLFSQKASVEVSSVICEENELAAVFKFSNLGEAQHYIKASIKNYVSDSRYTTLLKNVEDEISSIFNKNGKETRKNSPR